MHKWQKDMLAQLHRGDQLFAVSYSRRTGKSMMTMAMMQAAIDARADWTKSWRWPWRRVKSISNKKIWGTVYYRWNRGKLSSIGGSVCEYATKKDIFKERLKG